MSAPALAASPGFCWSCGARPQPALLAAGDALRAAAIRHGDGRRGYTPDALASAHLRELLAAAVAVMREVTPDLRVSTRPDQEGPHVLTWRIAVIGAAVPHGRFVAPASEGYVNPAGDTLFINCFIRDEGSLLHDHGSHSASYMLAGTLAEEWKRDPRVVGPPRRSLLEAGGRIIRPASMVHRLLRVDGHQRPVSLYAVGPSEQVWGWWDDDGGRCGLWEHRWGFWSRQPDGSERFIRFGDTEQGQAERRMAETGRVAS